MIFDLLKKYRWHLVVVLLIAALATSVYFYNQYATTKKLLDNPKNAVSEEKTALLKKIGALIELPANEDPTVATVTDSKKLSTNPFFAKSINGDRVLFYTKAKEAILYRPSTNKIIEVSQISIESSAPAGTSTSTVSGTVSNTATVTPTPQSKGKLVIYNGTKIAGLASKEKDFILSKTTNLDVIQMGDANGNYTENFVIALKTEDANAANQLAGLVSGKVVPLPQGESAPRDGDLLLIVGKQ